MVYRLLTMWLGADQILKLLVSDLMRGLDENWSTSSRLSIFSKKDKCDYPKTISNFFTATILYFATRNA